MARTPIKDQNQRAEITNPGIGIKAVTARKALLDTQRMYGAENAYSPFVKLNNTGAVHQIQVDTAGTKLTLSYTPAVDVWWEVKFHNGQLDEQQAAQNYIYAYLIMSAGTPAIGPTTSLSISSQHVNGRRYSGLRTSRLWGLTANTAYTCQAWFNGTGGALKYYMGAEYLTLEGAAWAR